MQRTPIRAVLFDIDGTLVDSNYAHVTAWLRAFAELEQPVDAWRIHAAIGMDSSQLLETLLGEQSGELGDRAKELHNSYYGELAGELRPLAGARELVREVERRGQKAVLATSAPEAELTILRKILQVEESIAAVTSSEDVEVAKPEPDIVQIALERAGVSADEAVFVGDSRWDVEAAGRAGVRCLALRSGGTGASELYEAGAVSVWDDAADLLAHYDEALGAD